MEPIDAKRLKIQVLNTKQRVDAIHFSKNGDLFKNI